MDQALLDLKTAEPDAQFKFISADTVLVTFDKNVDLESKADALSQAKPIRSVEANAIYRLEEIVPNDPEFSRLYSMKNTGQSLGKAGADIKATYAWDMTVGSRSVVVGIIDSGADYTHPDLRANIWTNPGEAGTDAEGRDKTSNGIDDDANGFIDDFHGWDFFNNDNNPMDDNSHGTHVAGTIGASGNNGTGVVGVNWQVSMLPIKVFSGSGESTTEALIQGIDYATRMGVSITNNSWGGGAFSDAILAAIQRANSAGILFVAAAGNNGTNNDESPHYPSNYEVANILSVAATNRKDLLASFSSYGKVTVDIAAPGEDIYSTVPGGGYGLKSGTSMATPHVVGVAALIKSRFPNISAADLRKKILNSAAKPEGIARSVGEGRIDASAAVEDDTLAPNAVANFALVSVGLHQVELRWTASGDDGAEGKAAAYQVRFSAERISDEAAWNAAKPMDLTNFLEGTDFVTGILQGFEYNTTGFLAIRAIDNGGNLGEISSDLAFTLKAVEVLWTENNDTLVSWLKVDAPWSTTTLANNQGSWLSDSPVGPYQNNINLSIVSKPFVFPNDDLILEVRSLYDFEKDYDFGFIEITTDQGKTWREVAKVTGKATLSTISYPIKTILAGSISFQLRLRVQSDYSLTYNGWDIDSLQIVGAAP